MLHLVEPTCQRLGVLFKFLKQCFSNPKCVLSMWAPKHDMGMKIASNANLQT
jgi:hypothetical protein